MWHPSFRAEKCLCWPGLDVRKKRPSSCGLAHCSQCARGERGGREKERSSGKEEAKKGRWKVSVRNASLLEDNPRAGPVCFKSNQSIRINYPPPPSIPLPPPSRVAHTGTRTRGGLGVRVCVFCFLVSVSTHARTDPHTQPPTSF